MDGAIHPTINTKVDKDENLKRDTLRVAMTPCLVESKTAEEYLESEIEPTDGSPPKRVKALRDIYESYAFALKILDPISYEEAQKSSQWRETMKQEMEAIERNETWELIVAPSW